MQNLSKETINNTGFDKIRETLLKLSNSESNHTYFKDLIPSKKLNELTNHLSLSDIIHQGIIRRDDVDIYQIINMSDILSKIKIKGSHLLENEFKKLHTILEVNQKLKSILSISSFKGWKILQSVYTNKKWLQLIEQKFDSNFNIKSSASKKISKLYKDKKTIEKNIDNKIKEHYDNAKKKNWLQNDNISWINERLVLPFKVSLKNKIEGIIHQYSSSGQTAFIEPLEIVKLNNIKNQNEFDIHIEKKKILLELTLFFHKIATKIDSINHFINKYDRHLTIAKYAYKTNSIKPNFNSESVIKIKNGINPFIKDSTTPTPLNFEMDRETNICIVSGPNTGGKTVVLKSIGLYTIMAQSGLFIPADYFGIPFFDNVLTDMGDNQSIESGLSTFSSHLMNIKNIIEISTINSLVLLDEIGTGTDPNSSMAIAQAVLEKFNTIKMKLITTTHLVNLKDWASRTKHVENGMMKFDKNNFSPTYEFISGIPGSSYAIEISKKMGLHNKIINRAKSLMGTDATKLDGLIDKIQKNQSEIQTIKKNMELELNQIEIQKKKLTKIRQKLNEEKSYVKYKSGLEADEYLKETKRNVEKVIEQIKMKNASTASIKNVKETIEIELAKSKQKIIKNKKKQKQLIDKEKITIGQKFLIKSLDLIGIVESAVSSDEKVFLNVEGKRIKIDYSELCKPINITPNQNNKLHSKFEVSNISSNNIDLRGLNVEDAINALDKFIDSAYINNILYIKILHGTGTGALQEGIHKYLKLHKNVKTYNFAPLESGGYGVTELTLI